jgi:hypothetical protein
MKAAWTIFRRELCADFNAPMAYVVAIATLLLNSSLFVLDFWIVGQVSMRSWFEWASWTLCLIVPAITMSSWAEDRKGGTYELLLTFPMRSLDLVFGKFLAAWTFFAACIAGSLVIPVVLRMISTPGLGPEWGVIAAAYLGTLLAAALLTGLGLLVSSLCRDQIEAFIVSTVLAFALRLLGHGGIAGQLESVFPWLGNFLRESVSYWLPFGRFARGLVDFGDVLFFLTWTAAFLLLNALGLEGRCRRGAARLHAAVIALGLPVAALLAGLWLQLGLPRADLTADRIFTVSDAAVGILGEIPEEKPVRLKLLVSPRKDMPTPMRDLERDVLDRLEAFQRKAKGRLLVEVVHLHADDAILRALQERGPADPDDSERGEVEENLAKQGVLPFRVGSGGLTGSETKVIYSALTLSYGAGKKEVIPRVLPSSLASLEQDLVTRVFRLLRQSRPVVGLMAPLQAVDIDPQRMQLLSQLGIAMDQMPREQDDYRYLAAILGEDELYDLRRLRPNDEAPLPSDLDTLVVVQPENLSPGRQYEIARFLHEGGSVILAVQSYLFDLRSTGYGLRPSFLPVTTGLEAALEHAGLSVPQEILMSDRMVPMAYGMGPFGQAQTVEFPWIFELDAASFDAGTSLSNGVGGFMLVEAGAPVRVDALRTAELGLDVQPVLSSADDAWTRTVPSYELPADFGDPGAAEGPVPLAVLVRGQFPPPEGAPPEDPAQADNPLTMPAEPVPAAGSLLVMGTARPFLDQLIVEPSTGALGWAGVLAKNATDALSLDEALLGLSLREPRSRPIAELSRSQVLLWQFVIVGFAPLIYLVLGIVRMLGRKRRQERKWEPQA